MERSGKIKTQAAAIVSVLAEAQVCLADFREAIVMSKVPFFRVFGIKGKIAQIHDIFHNLIVHLLAFRVFAAKDQKWVDE